jgi:hypothetical protein
MLAWWTLLPVVVVLLVEATWGYPSVKLKWATEAATARTDLTFPYEFGRLIGGLGIPLLIAALVWWPSKSRVASSTVFSVLAMLICLTTFSEYHRASRKATAAVTSQITSSYKQQASDAAAAQNAVVAGGGLGSASASIESPGELERLIALLDAAATATHAQIDAADTIGSRLRDELRQAGVAEPALQRWTADFERGFNWPAHRPLIASNERVFRARLATLEYLRDHRGHWSYHAEAHRFEFDSDEAAAEFNRLTAETRAAPDENRALDAERSPPPQGESQNEKPKVP